MAILFNAGRFKATDLDNAPISGAFLAFYALNTSTPQPVYTDPSLTVALMNPVQADGNGLFPEVWLDDSLPTYKVVFLQPDVTDPTIPGATIWTIGQYNTAFNVDALNRLQNPQTPAELNAGVIPTNFLYRPYTFLRYGLDPTGAVDSTTAINNCFLAAAQANHATVRMGISGALVKVNGAINWPVDKVGCDWEGAFLDCTGLTSGYTLNPTATFADSTTRVGLVKSHPMENFTAMGPSTASNHLSGTGFINITDTGTGTGLAGITIRNGGCYNFFTHFNSATGCFFTAFENWEFATVVYNAANGFTSNFLNLPVAAVSGERNSFTNCYFGIAASSTSTVILNQANNNADTYFKNCSFDAIGAAGRLFTITNGACFWDGCHLEASLDTDYWVFVSGNSTVFAWDQLTIVVDGAKTAFPIFQCDSSVVSGAISVGSTFFVDVSAYSLPLIGGTGIVVQPGPVMVFVGGTLPNYVADALNILSNGLFGITNFTRDGWVAAGPAVPTIVNTPLPPAVVWAPTAVNVIKFTVASAQTNTLTLTRPCKPGQIITGQYYLRADLLTGSGANFNVGVAYLDASGATLLSYNSTFPSGITTTQAYTLTSLNPGGGGYVRAPRGTVNVFVQMTFIGVTVTGAPIVYVGSIELDIQ
jgi:hypothetical protein